MSSKEENTLILPVRTRAQMRAYQQRQQEIARHAVADNTSPRLSLRNRNIVRTQAQMRTYQQRQQEIARHAVADNISPGLNLRNRNRVSPVRTRAQMRTYQQQRQQEIASYAVARPPRRNLRNRNRVVTQISTPLPSHDGADSSQRGTNRSRLLRQQTTARMSTSRPPVLVRPLTPMPTLQEPSSHQSGRAARMYFGEVQRQLRSTPRRSTVSQYPEPPQSLHRSTVNVQTGDTRLLSAIGSDTTEGEGFICRICLDRCNEPKATPCGHVFCGLCIHCYIASLNFNLNIRCPNCRAPISSESLLRIYV